MAGVGTDRVIGIDSFYLDFNVPYKTFGVKRRYLLRMNLKNALLFPELNKVIDSDVLIYKEAESNSNFKFVRSIYI